MDYPLAAGAGGAVGLNAPEGEGGGCMRDGSQTSSPEERSESGDYLAGRAPDSLRSSGLRHTAGSAKGGSVGLFCMSLALAIRH